MGCVAASSPGHRGLLSSVPVSPHSPDNPQDFPLHAFNKVAVGGDHGAFSLEFLDKLLLNVGWRNWNWDFG